MRLIDADELKTAFPRCDNSKPVLVAYVRATINHMPTIEQERKTGKWQKLHGYVTPGGDPVWCCSECGKGIHVFGIEHNSYGKDIADHQWLSCPNCDAKMIGEEE